MINELIAIGLQIIFNLNIHHVRNNNGTNYFEQMKQMIVFIQTNYSQ